MALNSLFIRIVEIKPRLYIFSVRKSTSGFCFFTFLDCIISPAALHQNLHAALLAEDSTLRLQLLHHLDKANSISYLLGFGLSKTELLVNRNGKKRRVNIDRGHFWCVAKAICQGVVEQSFANSLPLVGTVNEEEANVTIFLHINHTHNFALRDRNHDEVIRRLIEYHYPGRTEELAYSLLRAIITYELVETTLDERENLCFLTRFHKTI